MVPLGPSTRFLRAAVSTIRVRFAYSGLTMAYSTERTLQDNEDFYAYTRGRFLFDEEVQLKERYKKFSIPALQDVAVRTLGADRCMTIKKLAEGSFNKVFHLTMDTGQEIVARIPHPNAGVERYTTASEVATMHYLRTKLGLPIPQVLAYSCEPQNPVESEYIILEKVDGVNVSSRWYDMDESDQKAIVESLAEMHSKLLNVQFSHYGNLYFTHDIPRSLCAPTLYSHESPDDETYCIGPTADSLFWQNERAKLKLDRGPWTTLQEYTTAVCQREIQWIKSYAKPRPENDPLRQVDSQEDPQCHIDLLERCIQVFFRLNSPSHCTTATLWNDDVNLENIMVSNDTTNPEIVSLIDWQNVCIAPLYLQFSEPSFLPLDFCSSPLDATSQIYKRPLLDNESPGNTSSLRNLYIQTLTRRFPTLQTVLSLPYAETQKMLLLKAGQSWLTRKGIISLRQGLINCWRNWKQYEQDGPPPISFSQPEINLHLEEGAGMNGQLDFIWTIIHSIGMSQTGEVEVEEYEEKKREYEDTKRRWTEEMNREVEESGSLETVDWEVYWPFRYPQLGF